MLSADCQLCASIQTCLASPMASFKKSMREVEEGGDEEEDGDKGEEEEGRVRPAVVLQLRPRLRSPWEVFSKLPIRCTGVFDQCVMR